jgi:hypothetical protein
MLRFPAGENFNGAIVRGLLSGSPDMDNLTLHDAGFFASPAQMW